MSGFGQTVRQYMESGGSSEMRLMEELVVIGFISCVTSTTIRNEKFWTAANIWELFCKGSVFAPWKNISHVFFFPYYYVGVVTGTAVSSKLT